MCLIWCVSLQVYYYGLGNPWLILYVQVLAVGPPMLSCCVYVCTGVLLWGLLCCHDMCLCVQVYYYGASYAAMTVGGLLGLVPIAHVFAPKFHSMHLLSAFEVQFNLILLVTF